MVDFRIRIVPELQRQEIECASGNVDVVIEGVGREAERSGIEGGQVFQAGERPFQLISRPDDGGGDFVFSRSPRRGSRREASAASGRTSCYGGGTAM